MTRKELSVAEAKALNRAILGMKHGLLYQPENTAFKVSYQYKDETHVSAIANGALSHLKAIRMQAVRNIEHLYYCITVRVVRAMYVTVTGEKLRQTEACVNSHIKLLEQAANIAEDTAAFIEELDFAEDDPDTEEVIIRFRLLACMYVEMAAKSTKIAMKFFGEDDDTDKHCPATEEEKQEARAILAKISA